MQRRAIKFNAAQFVPESAPAPITSKLLATPHDLATGQSKVTLTVSPHLRITGASRVNLRYGRLNGNSQALKLHSQVS